MKKTLLILTSLSASLAYGGATGFASIDNDIFLANGTTIPVGGVVLLGFFSSAPSSNVSFAASAGSFTELARTTITDGGGFGTYTGSVTTNGTNADVQLYQWIFSTSTPATAPEHALFTSAVWKLTGSGPADTKQFTVETATSTIVGTLDKSGAFPAIKLAAIPEPSTYALMGLGLVVVGFMARRRK